MKVIVERRRVLMLPALAALALTRPEDLIAQESLMVQGEQKKMEKIGSFDSIEAGEIGWSNFVEQCIPVAQRLHKDASSRGQDAYLYWIASMAVRMRLSEMPRANLQKFGSLDPAIHIGVSYKGAPFFFVEWRMEPGAILPAHCHPNASVCTLGLEGEARIRHFEIVGDAPEFASKKPFQVRETRNEIVAPGRVSTLSATRDNIHFFQAGKDGARGVDISSYHGPDIGFSFIDMGEKPLDPAKKTFEAVWKKL